MTKPQQLFDYLALLGPVQCCQKKDLWAAHPKEELQPQYFAVTNGGWVKASNLREPIGPTGDENSCYVNLRGIGK